MGRKTNRRQKKGHSGSATETVDPSTEANSKEKNSFDDGWPQFVKKPGGGRGIAWKNSNDLRSAHLTLRAGGQTLVTDSPFALNWGQVYGLVGRNGLGKSTLLRALRDHEAPPFSEMRSLADPSLNLWLVDQEVIGDERDVFSTVLEANRELAWLAKQRVKLDFAVVDDETEEHQVDGDDGENRRQLIEERWQELQGDRSESDVHRILAGLGFISEQERRRPTGELSGGWRMRVALAQALFVRPDILLLDEPSNHLDLESAWWLERHLQSEFSEGKANHRILVVASHDRGLLTSVARRIIHFPGDGTIGTFSGGFEGFMCQRQIEMCQAKKKAKEKKKKKPQSQGHKGEKAHATQRRTEEELRQQAEKDLQRRRELFLKVPHFCFPEPSVVKKVECLPIVRLNGVGFRFASSREWWFRDLDFSLALGDRIGLLGPNGSGKSTLLNLLCSELSPSEGNLALERGVVVAKFSQHHVDRLDYDLTPYQYLESKWPITTTDGDGTTALPQSRMTIIRKHLGLFGLSGSLATTSICQLSGGQKSRVALAEICISQPSVILLDEPTNHLDLETTEALTCALKDFTGALVIVSHNRHFLQEVCNQFWMMQLQPPLQQPRTRIEKLEFGFDEYVNRVLSSEKLTD